ncbi:hypothetical protein BDQ17DRAFT_1477049, partial [Cyathus striatus]
MTLDEMHIIEEWKDYFRKAYRELRILKVMMKTIHSWIQLPQFLRSVSGIYRTHICMNS